MNKESLIIEDSVEQPAISPPEQFEVLMNQVHETFSAHEFSDEVATDLKSYVEGVWSELHVSLDKDGVCGNMEATALLDKLTTIEQTLGILRATSIVDQMKRVTDEILKVAIASEFERVVTDEDKAYFLRFQSQSDR